MDYANYCKNIFGYFLKPLGQSIFKKAIMTLLALLGVDV
jgi:hypothetical protein